MVLDLEGRLPRPVLPGPRAAWSPGWGLEAPWPVAGVPGWFIATVKQSVLGVTRDISVLSSEGARPSHASLFQCLVSGAAPARVGGLGQLSKLPNASAFFSVKMGCE